MAAKYNMLSLLESVEFHGDVYHGSNARFDEFSQDKARIVNDFWGGGVAYFTDKTQLAKEYAKGMVKRYKGRPFVYKVTLELNKMFDVDDTFTGKELTQFIDDPDKFARGAGLMKLDVDKYLLIAQLQKGAIELTGEQVFKGLSTGMVNTAETRKKLMSLGYDGLRYNGGDNMGMKRHNVYLIYNVSSIKSFKRFKVVS